MAAKRSFPYDDEDELSYDDDEAMHEVSDEEDTAQTITACTYDYTVLSESDIRLRQDADIASVSATYSVPRSSAILLLRHFSWIRSKLDDAWLLDEPSVRKDVGLPDQTLPPATPAAVCGICFDPFPTGEDARAASCGHPFCVECWGGYIGCNITDGDRCLSLRCPEPKCQVAVGEDMVMELAPTEDDKKRYNRYLVRSYIDDNKYTKWCPAPECIYAVSFNRGVGGFDVKCRCSNKFCWNCSEEPHQPVDCETVKNWITKNSAEAENVTYILAYTKPCPKCQKPIEKNMGCNHMTCRCGHHFCWICLADNYNHGGCNAYNASTQKRAQMSLERYTHYYERFENNLHSQQKALKDRDDMKDKNIEKVKEAQKCYEEAKIAFIDNAWEQIVKCRSVLKWSYAYGYYHVHPEEPKKKAFFEYLQGQAQEGLEKLHYCAETEMKPYLNSSDGPTADFDAFRVKLTTLTTVTKTHFEKFVTALQNGLSDFDSAGGAGVAGSNNDIIDGDFLEADWYCERCTYFNEGNTDGYCGMCFEADPLNWSCSGCTLANARAASHCDACGLRRPDIRLCPSCTYANPPAEERCRVCQASL